MGVGLGVQTVFAASEIVDSDMSVMIGCGSDGQRCKHSNCDGKGCERGSSKVELHVLLVALDCC